MQNTEIKTTKAQTSDQYDLAEKPLFKVRTCNKGSDEVKRQKTVLLPHPSDVDQVSDSALLRYEKYINGAEFPGYTDETRRTMLGKMRFIDADIEVPDEVDYLIENADGDGTSLKAMMELQTSEVLQTKWLAFVVDFNGLGQVDLDSVSKADVKAANPRAVIKSYSRENIINWSFKRINGVMQLAWIDLVEWGEEFDEQTKTTSVVESHLELGLDETGYYQKKVVYNERGTNEDGERDYVTVDGEVLQWIPIIFCSDEQLRAGELPIQVGYLGQIADIDLAQYRKSAVYTETQKAIAPTTYTKGWQNGDKELFEEVNGRSKIETGAYAVNNLPNNVSVEVVGVGSELDSFQYDFEQYDKRVIALGGASPSTGGNMTATEADINASKQNAMLSQMADTMEAATKRAVSYCCMFEGEWSPDEVESMLDEITITLPRDFATPKLSIEEVAQLRGMYLEGVLTIRQLATALFNGGWGVGDSVEEMIGELESGQGVLPPSRDVVVDDEPPS